jgi:hypothetical protein
MKICSFTTTASFIQHDGQQNNFLHLNFYLIKNNGQSFIFPFKHFQIHFS